ncbi:MAG TPA: penicillin-binding transpeptidase domain-containing protein [Gammaproteobacteria bacterium]|nr:penicillin-binding transpeptidase domain-containing protein [Gammaproteobacteria bacterium]
MNSRAAKVAYPGRRRLVLGLLAGGFVSLVARAVDLQVVDKAFLQNEGDARHLRVVKVPAHRGMIVDRRGEPLAISTPVDSVWANPQELPTAGPTLAKLAAALHLDGGHLRRLLAQRSSREFVYLKRQLPPGKAHRVMALGIPGVYLQREYRRYYPAGEVTAHVLGFTNIDDRGQEGLELAYDDWLRGEAGEKRVIQDGRHHIIEDVDSIRAPRPGHKLTLSIDRRIQYLAYRELKAAVLAHHARSGSAVVLDPTTGEVLAMVNQPSYNPNNRKRLHAAAMRNRAVTDVFEPGSTLKPFTIAAALESGLYTPHTPIDTAPGYLKVGSHTIRDDGDYGMLDVTGVIRKSSNVGASKIALSLPPKREWSMLARAGFGEVTGSGFPGEASGLLSNYRRWHNLERATVSFGYGVSVTAVQLARAYAVLADGGIRRPVSFVKLNKPPAGKRVLSAHIAEQVRTMLETVVSPQGTGERAAVAGYHVAGKTGTVHKSIPGGYAPHRYLSLFAGMAPASDPRLVTVVMINEPKGDYFGGLVAAPVFSKIMSGALRLLDIPPDDLPLVQNGHGRSGGAA